jgi:methionyl-tRNA formyltransferase
MGKLKIVFMGTPHFASATLGKLIESGEDVSLVITQPDRPQGRGLNVAESPVKKLAVQNGIETLTPLKIKSKEVINRIREASPDLIVVSAYGKIIPSEILTIPKYYPINVHGSLLPKYRGAAPINWAIINGEEKTGITIMKMNEEMDAGDIMLQEETRISEDDNSETLHDRLAVIGGKLIVQAIDLIKSGKAQFKTQDESLVTFAPMLKKDDGLIKWQLPSKQIFNFVRGMNPWPGAFSFLGGKLVKIHAARLQVALANVDHQKQPTGSIIGITSDSLLVKAGDGAILLGELQFESKKRLKAKEFARGLGNMAGLKFTDSR